MRRLLLCAVVAGSPGLMFFAASAALAEQDEAAPPLVWRTWRWGGPRIHVTPIRRHHYYRGWCFHYPDQCGQWLK